MKASILDHLKAMASGKNIEILFACESGSRSWGFPSPGSDYDVRFIYRHPQSWYLSLFEQKDQINYTDGLYDYNGWDLGKTLKLGAKSNQALMEWVDSPIIYLEKEGFKDELKSVLLNYFNPKAAIYHYLSLAKSTYSSSFKESQVKLKKYFYLIRPILAAVWIGEHLTSPPVLFSELLPLLDEKSLKAVNKLLKLKETANTSTKVDRDIELESSVLKMAELVELKVGKINYSKPEMEELDHFFKSIIME